MKASHPHTGNIRVIRTLLIAAGVLVLLSLITVITMGALIFSKERLFETPLQPGDLAVQTGIANRILPDTLRNTDPRTTARLELTPEEVNSLIRVVANAEDIAAMFGVRRGSRKAPVPGTNYRIAYEQGKFHIACSIDTDWPTPFGSHILVHAVVAPTLRDREIVARIDAAKIGALSIMTGVVETILGKALVRLLEHEDAERVYDIIQELYIDQQHNLVIVYYPAALKNFLLTEALSRMGKRTM